MDPKMTPEPKNGEIQDACNDTCCCGGPAPKPKPASITKAPDWIEVGAQVLYISPHDERGYLATVAKVGRSTTGGRDIVDLTRVEAGCVATLGEDGYMQISDVQLAFVRPADSLIARRETAEQAYMHAADLARQLSANLMLNARLIQKGDHLGTLHSAHGRVRLWRRLQQAMMDAQVYHGDALGMQHVDSLIDLALAE